MQRATLLCATTGIAFTRGIAADFPRARCASRPRSEAAHLEIRAPSLMAEPENDERQPIARNRRARFDYHILETWEAGIVLTGPAVKALRAGKANISDAYAVVNGGEVFLLNLNIPPYEQGNRHNHEPTRTRKLLLHRREIRRMIGAVERQGLTLVALELYFKKGVAKV